MKNAQEHGLLARDSLIVPHAITVLFAAFAHLEGRNTTIFKSKITARNNTTVISSTHPMRSYISARQIPGTALSLDFYSLNILRSRFIGIANIRLFVRLCDDGACVLAVPTSEAVIRRRIWLPTFCDHDCPIIKGKISPWENTALSIFTIYIHIHVLNCNITMCPCNGQQFYLLNTHFE